MNKYEKTAVFMVISLLSIGVILSVTTGTIKINLNKPNKYHWQIKLLGDGHFVNTIKDVDLPAGWELAYIIPVYDRHGQIIYREIWIKRRVERG